MTTLRRLTPLLVLVIPAATVFAAPGTDQARASLARRTGEIRKVPGGVDPAAVSATAPPRRSGGPATNSEQYPDPCETMPDLCDAFNGGPTSTGGGSSGTAGGMTSCTATQYCTSCEMALDGGPSICTKAFNDAYCKCSIVLVNNVKSCSGASGACKYRPH